MICVAFVDPIRLVHSVALAVYFGWLSVFALGLSPTVFVLLHFNRLFGWLTTPSCFAKRGALSVVYCPF